MPLRSLIAPEAGERVLSPRALAQLARIYELAGAGYNATAIARKMKLPRAVVWPVLEGLEQAEKAADRDAQAETETTKRIFSSMTRRPCYGRDGQDNPVPPDPTHHMPGPTGVACHTSAWNKVDPDFLEDRARGINQTEVGG